MISPKSPRLCLFASAVFLGQSLWGALQEVEVGLPSEPVREGFRMGASLSPSGVDLSLDSRSLLRDGRRLMPVMGEVHYTRLPESEWRTELLKMKAGGIDIVATYVFWNHHEELEGQWDWSGCRDLRRFLGLCRELGLQAVVRCGPWCHGEVRNGGLPDWLLAKGWKVRSDDPDYLARADRLYGEIAAQVRGLLWKDGGPVVAVQLENEYGGPAEHLLTLKRMARAHGLDVPWYTRTGWPLLKTPLPHGEILPLFGAYAEGFWDRPLTTMPGNYWAAFHFNTVRTDTAIANEQLGQREAEDEADAHRYPYLTCELGGGMMSSYHRRIAIDPADVEAVTLVKIGSGGNLPGYYMYHGGRNPEARQGTLMETQSSPITNWNDMPVRGYDFYAPLGEYGQLRPHYHLLRRLHLLARSQGETLASMPAWFPRRRPAGRDDFDTLRWSLRSDGESGFLFINNHHRAGTLPAQADTRFRASLPAGVIEFPLRPVTLPAGVRCIWPLRLRLDEGLVLRHATAQPLCHVDGEGGRVHFFAATPGVPAEFALEGPEGLELAARSGTVTTQDGLVLVRDSSPGRGVAFTLERGGRRVSVVLLDEADSLSLWKGECLGAERVVLSGAGVVFDGGSLVATGVGGGPVEVGLFPAPGTLRVDGREEAPAQDGVFARVRVLGELQPAGRPAATLLREAGPAREPRLGASKSPVAAAPEDRDFAAAAEWRIEVPREAVERGDLLRLRYTGDVARVLIDGRLVTDDFYNGRPLEVGLWRHREALLAGGVLSLQVLPLKAGAPVYLAGDLGRQLAREGLAAGLRDLELVPLRSAVLTGR